MKKAILFAVSLVAAQCLVGVAPSAADVIEFQGINEMAKFANNADIYVTFPGDPPDLFNENVAVGMIPVTANGVPVQSYCLNLFTDLYALGPYSGTVSPAPLTSKTFAIACIIKNNPLDPAGDKLLGTSIQAAVWLLHHINDPLVTVFPPGNAANNIVNDMAMAMIQDVLGKRLLSCPEAAPVTFEVEAISDRVDPNLVNVTVTALVGGLPAVGQPVKLTTTQGTFLTPLNGEGVIAPDGTLTAAIDLGGQAPDLTVTAEAHGRSEFIIVADELVAQDLVFTKPCRHVATATLQGGDYLGNPKTLEFWKLQFRIACGANGIAQVPKEALESYLLLMDLVDLEVETLQDACDLLWIQDDATMAQRAIQQCLAMWLNFLHGELEYLTLVDVDFDGVPDMTFAEALALFEFLWESGDFERGKDICDSINSMGNDGEEAEILNNFIEARKESKKGE